MNTHNGMALCDECKGEWFPETLHLFPFFEDSEEKVTCKALCMYCYNKHAKKKDRLKYWIVREWHHYGKWNQQLQRTLHFQARDKQHALAQYHAQYTPKFPHAATIKVSPGGE